MTGQVRFGSAEQRREQREHRLRSRRPANPRRKPTLREVRERVEGASQ